MLRSLRSHKCLQAFSFWRHGPAGNPNGFYVKSGCKKETNAVRHNIALEIDAAGNVTLCCRCLYVSCTPGVSRYVWN